MKARFFRPLIILISVCLVAGLIYIYGEWSKPKQGHHKLVQIEKQIRAQNTSLLENEYTKAYKTEDMQFLLTSISKPKREKQRTDFFRTSIHLLDRNILGSFPLQKKQEIYEETVTFLLKNRKNFRGEKARSMALATKVLGKMGKPESWQAQLPQLEKLFGKDADQSLRLLTLEALKDWAPFPGSAKSKLLTVIFSSDTSQSVSGLQLVSNIYDIQARKELLDLVSERFEKIDGSIQPIALKIVALHRGLTKGPIDSLIAKAAQKETDVWQDAFVFAVDKSNLAEKHASRLKEIHGKTTNPFLRKRIQSMLGITDRGSQ